MSKSKKMILWVVVKVQSGIPVGVEVFQNQKEAEITQKNWRSKMHPENDETGLFEVENYFRI
jgi:hypothetical protein